MIFEHDPISGPLTSYVETIIYFKDFQPEHSKERVIPTGHVFLIFELDGFERQVFDPKTLQPLHTFTKVWISGMHRHFLTISAHADSEMLAIQFKPDGAFPFFHKPISDLNEKIVAAELIFGDSILSLREKVLSANGYADKFAVVRQYLQQRFDEKRVPPVELRNFITEIIKHPLQPLHNVMQSYPHSAQYLLRQFKKYVGLRPKYLLRILRFNQMMKQISNREELVWTDVAYQNGFFDQSHFIKEFKHFSGFNPKEFMEQNFHRESVNFFPLDGQ